MSTTTITHHTRVSLDSIDEHHLVRTRNFPRRITIEEVLLILRHEHATGTVSIDLSQGGVGSIRFTESQKIDPR